MNGAKCVVVLGRRRGNLIGTVTARIGRDGMCSSAPEPAAEIDGEQCNDGEWP